MCGVFGLVAHEPVNQLLYDGLQMLQHRGQDAADIAAIISPVIFCLYRYKAPYINTYSIFSLYPSSSICKKKE